MQGDDHELDVLIKVIYSSAISQRRARSTIVKKIW